MNILSEKKSSEKLILVIFLTISGFFLRFAYLTERPIWYDEGITIFNAESSLAYIWRNFIHGSNPPFAYSFYHFWQLVFGSQQLSYEIVSVIFGTAALILIYRIGKLLFDEEVGLIASALLAFSSYHLFVSQQIRGYSMACFFALYSIDQLFRFLRSSRRIDLVGWFTASALMMMTHFYTVFLFAVELLAFRIAKARSSRRAGSIKVYAIGSILILFAAIVGIQVTRILNIFPFYPRPHANFSDLFLVLQSVFFLSKPLVLMSLGLVIWRLKDSPKNPHVQFLFAWLLVSMLVPFVISWFVPSFFYVRYYIFTHLAWALLAAYAIRQIPRGTIRLVVVSVFIFFLTFLISDYYQESHEKSKLKSVLEMVEREFKSGDAIVHENGWTFGTSYYYHRGRLPEFYLTDEFLVPTLQNRKMNLDEMHRYKRLWLQLEMPESMEKLQREVWFKNLPKRLIKSYPDAQLYLFDLQS